MKSPVPLGDLASFEASTLQMKQKALFVYEMHRAHDEQRRDLLS